MGLGLVGTPMYTACVLRGALHFFNKVFLLLIKKKKNFSVLFKFVRVMGVSNPSVMLRDYRFNI
jgi:hypothetical protein